MKKNIRNLALSAAVLTLACSFVDKPVSVGGTAPEFTLKTIPVGGVYAVFAGKYGGEITKKEMNGQQELKVEGCHKDSKIVKFTLEVTKSGKTTSLQTESNVLTQEMLTKLKVLSPGDGFEFKHIKARLSNSNELVDVRGSKFVVVEKGA